MADIINSLGFVGVASLLGCWLVIGAIIGKLIALNYILKQDVVLPYVYQRILLAIVGIAFLVPGLHTLYFGSAAARTVAPVTPDYVSPGDNLSHTSLHPLWFGSTRNPVQLRSLEYHPAQLALVPAGGVVLLGQRSCNKVESFGLYTNNLRRLKYSGFRGRVYVYVGPISKPQQGTEVYLFSTDGSAPRDGKIDYVTFQRLWGEGSPLRQAASIHAPGDSVTFPYGGTQYRLTVQQIYKVLLGADEIVVDMCAL